MKESSFVETQLARLAEMFGEPLRWDVALTNEGVFDPLAKSDRYGEVCMVIRRPSGALLTAKKTFYPAGAYRLLTGGIHHGEAILDALVRETHEETGLDTEIRRFLAAISYRYAGWPQDQAPHFSTFAFLLDEIGGTLQCHDPGERVEDFREIDVDELPRLAEHLASLQRDVSTEIGGRWHDWGQFRAVIHRAVYQALRDER